MDAIIQENKALILSTLYMVFGLMAAGYSIFYSSAVVYKSDIRKVSNALNETNKELEQKIKEVEKKDEKEIVGIRYLPTFLARINEIAHNNEVIIRKLSPDQELALKFTLEFIADYPTFIRFTSELESLDITLDDIQLHPYDSGKTPPLHAISFSIIPRNDAKELTGDRLEKLKKWVLQQDKRNPFQRFAYDMTRKRISPVIDLTWIYKLGGLGQSTDGKPYASINRQNYYLGDKLDGREIERIESDRVFLKKTTRDGTIRYMLTFRKTKKD